jgi:imidazoleglycerol-phosphate dehydratase
MTPPRRYETVRKTRETFVSLSLDLDEPGESSARTGLPFLDHMLEAFACHSRIRLAIEADGDLHVDPHHLVEDVGLVLGATLAGALETSPPVARAGCFTFPMDGSLAHAAVDLCGRPNLVWNVPVGEAPVGTLDPRLFRDFFKGLSDGARATTHLHVPYSDGDHHAIEAVFKAFGRAVREAITPVGVVRPLSTKGIIDGSDASPPSGPHAAAAQRKGRVGRSATPAATAKSVVAARGSMQPRKARRRSD